MYDDGNDGDGGKRTGENDRHGSDRKSYFGEGVT